MPKAKLKSKTTSNRPAQRRLRVQRRVRPTVKQQLQAANDMLTRIHGICDEYGIPTTDGDIPPLEIQFCEGHRVKLMGEKLAAVMAAEQELRERVIAFVKKHDDSEEPAHEVVSHLKFVLDETQWWA